SSRRVPRTSTPQSRGSVTVSLTSPPSSLNEMPLAIRRPQNEQGDDHGAGDKKSGQPPPVIPAEETVDFRLQRGFHVECGSHAAAGGKGRRLLQEPIGRRNPSRRLTYMRKHGLRTPH